MKRRRARPIVETFSDPSRRIFLQSAAATSAILIGCSEDATNPPGQSGGAGSGGDGGAGGMGGAGGAGGAGGGTEDCLDPFAGGELLAVLDFVDEADFALNTPFNEGWDGRLYTDLTVLDDDHLVIANENFYIRTRYPDLLVPPDPWTIEVSGLATAQSLMLEDLLADFQDQGTHTLECSGNHQSGSFGLLSAAQWGGVRVSDVLAKIAIDPAATRVLVSGFDEHSVPSAGGHSTPGASWVFTFDELESTGAFLATEMNGEPLPLDHGSPVRLFVPGWYGCTCIKWVNEIVLVDDAEPATSQMKEFASRTHQIGVPELAKDYLPASLDQAAMPTRVEKWSVDGEIVYRIVGILWGGYEVTDALQIKIGNHDWTDVEVCPKQSQNHTWTLWKHAFKPESTGLMGIVLRIDDPNIVTKRLDAGYYLRAVDFDE